MNIEKRKTKIELTSHCYLRCTACSLRNQEIAGSIPGWYMPDLLVTNVHGEYSTILLVNFTVDPLRHDIINSSDVKNILTDDTEHIGYIFVLLAPCVCSHIFS